jgi:hypothetical protein
VYLSREIMTAPSFIATTGHGLAIARAQPGKNDGQWTVDQTLTDQDVRCLAADPLNRGVIYAGTQGKGVFRSADGGQSWLPAGLSGKVVKALAVSPIDSGVVYAGTKPPCLFVSRDSGASWTELEAFRRTPGRRFWFSPAETPFTAYIQGIALSPTDPQTIVVGIEAGAVVRSADGGQSWAGHRQGALRDCHSIMFHASNGNWVYEGGGTGVGAAFSQNAGDTWTQPAAGLDRHYGWACAADPERPEVWYVSLSPMGRGVPQAHVDGAANAYIFRSMGGEPWQKLTGGLPDPLNYMAYALVTDPNAPGHLYAGLSSGEVWHTAHYGDAWERLPFNLGGIYRTMIIV